jgi:hypothetical protein
LKRLTKDQKKNIFSTVKYPKLTHQELLALTVNETFTLANEFIIEGLSAKLSNFETVTRMELNDRENMDPKEIKK